MGGCNDIDEFETPQKFVKCIGTGNTGELALNDLKKKLSSKKYRDISVSGNKIHMGYFHVKWMEYITVDYFYTKDQNGIHATAMLPCH